MLLFCRFFIALSIGVTLFYQNSKYTHDSDYENLGLKPETKTILNEPNYNEFCRVSDNNSIAIFDCKKEW